MGDNRSLMVEFSTEKLDFAYEVLLGMRVSHKFPISQGYMPCPYFYHGRL